MPPCKRKRPLVPPPLKSLKKARELTSAFHAGQHGQVAAADAPDRAAYQDASVRATSVHKVTSRFVFSTLTRLGLRPPSGAPRPALLEVGAVNTQLLACPWLDVRAIDIRPAARGIEALDFFDLPVPEEGAQAVDGGKEECAPSTSSSFDVVVCAMVLNCVATPELRGEMLLRMRRLLRAPGGLAVVGLPRRCVEKGGRKDEGNTGEPSPGAWAAFEGAMAAAGLGPVVARKATPKIAYWAVGSEGRRDPGGWKGAGMGHDFSVVVPPVKGAGAAPQSKKKKKAPPPPRQE